MYKPTGRQIPHLAFLWPALAAASASEFAGSIAKQIIGLSGATDASSALEPDWTTPNSVALELNSVRLRDFSTAQEGVPTLLCAPFALHGAAIVDLAPEHSLVASLRAAGITRLFVTHWCSADDAMRFLTIDDYLADLNVLVDHLGGDVDLVGVCQGGWLSLMYAARFPTKVRKLVLAGAPIDIAAAPSGLTAITDSNPLSLFQELVKLGGGRVLGHAVQKFWGPDNLSADDIHQLLQAREPIDSPTFAPLEQRFRAWNAWTVDLPGAYYLEVVDRLYKHNALATGHFVALGQTIDLATMRAPLYLVAARDDELIAPAQLLATEQLVGTPAHDIHKEIVDGRHLGLFVGRKTLDDTWQRIAHWLAGAKRAKAAGRH